MQRLWMQAFWDEFCEAPTLEKRLEILRLYGRMRLGERKPEIVETLRRVHAKGWKEWLSQDTQCGCCFGKREIIHHIVHLARGGSLENDNLFPMCRLCHENVHDNLLAERPTTVDEDPNWEQDGAILLSDIPLPDGWEDWNEHLNCRRIHRNRTSRRS